MMPAWPAILPALPDVQGYNEQKKSQVVRSKMAAGPAKTRRRSTAAPRTISVRCGAISREAAAAFEAFFEDEIGAGTLPFDWPHPRLGTTVSAMIIGDPPYRLTPLGSSGVLWDLFLTLEIQP